MTQLSRALPDAVEFLNEKIRAAGFPAAPKTALVLGSGLGPIGEKLRDAVAIPYQDVPGFASSTVAGHAGKLIFGKLSGKLIAAMQGRLHFYEGHTMEQVTFPHRALRAIGVETLILTSAVGGISAKLKPGDLMAVRDHVNFMGENPLRGPHVAEYGARFPDMTEAYSRKLIALAKRAAKAVKVPLKEGIYCAVRGPSYETPAEIRLFKKWGADVVGMSVVPETVVANQAGMRVLAISCITNLAAGLAGKPLAHEEVMATGRRVEASFTALIAKIIEMLPA